MQVQYTCMRCGVVIFDYARVLRRYCSKACMYAMRKEQRTERFWGKVNKTPTCWLWTDSPGTDGYGKFSFRGDEGRTRTFRAHRYSYVLASGSIIPKGWQVIHTCDTRLCVRNDDSGEYIINDVSYQRFGHLALAPNDANMADMVAKQRSSHGVKNRGAKLTERQVQDIRSRFTGKHGQMTTLAAEYGVSWYTIRRIVYRHSWNNVQDLNLTAQDV